MIELEEFSIRVGEDTEFPALLTCTPNEDNNWMGFVHFDNDLYNWPTSFSGYNGGAATTIYKDWKYPREVAGGTYLMNLLEDWHKDIVAFIQRIRKDMAVRQEQLSRDDLATLRTIKSGYELNLAVRIKDMPEPTELLRIGYIERIGGVYHITPAGEAAIVAQER